MMQKIFLNSIGMKFLMLLSSLALWGMGDGCLFSTHNHTLTCKKISEDLETQLNHKQQYTLPMRHLSLIVNTTIFSPYIGII